MIASSPSPPAGVAVQCASCGTPLAMDQRYCLQCGERRMPMSSFLSGGMAGEQSTQSQSPPSSPSGFAPPTAPPRAAPHLGPPQRNSTLTVIAGVGVLLLAMGVGVLIGRSGASKTSVAPPQVISVSATPTTAPNGTAAETFNGDWTGGKGYAVQLQTLPLEGTTVSAVQVAKSTASAKGAKDVGALKSDEFSSLPGGKYLIYAGDFHKRGEAQKALGGLKKRFPGAKVVEVSDGSSGSAGAGGAGNGGGSGAGHDINHPAPPSVLDSTKGKNYSERSKNLPDVISTG